MAPILVVGAGTTGLTLACQLARQGCDVRVVDRAPAIDSRCRACLLRVRSLELLHEMGVAEELVAQGQSVLGTGFYSAGVRMPSEPVRIAGSRFSSPVCLEQWRIERTLAGLLLDLGVEIQRGAELIAIDERDASLIATVRRENGVEKMPVDWIVGCDGAQSRVRQLRGLEFVGERDPITYFVSDVVVEPPTPRHEVAVYVGDDAMLMAFPLPDGRSLLCGGDLLADGSARAPSLERAQGLARQRIAPDVTLRDPRWLGYFRIDYRLASAYRDGRVLLAGDAAHIYSPAGGQGMNTGIQDACNLAWKLALVSAGKGRDALLDTYETERRPVAEDVLTNTRLLTEHLKLVMELSGPFREALLRQAALAEGQERLAHHTEQLDLDYGAGAAGDEAGDFATGPRPGQQATDVAGLVRDGMVVRLSDVLRATCHTLLLFPDGTEASSQRLAALQGSACARYGGSITSHVVARSLSDPDGGLRAAYGVEGEALYLIRPDGHVAYRSQPASAEGLWAHLELTFA